jgi:hypothetical protein
MSSVGRSSHVSEALHLFPGWGLERSAGHYLDLSSAVVGLTLFPLGYFLQSACKSSGLAECTLRFLRHSAIEIDRVNQVSAQGQRQ